MVSPTSLYSIPTCHGRLFLQLTPADPEENRKNCKYVNI